MGFLQHKQKTKKSTTPEHQKQVTLQRPVSKNQYPIDSFSVEFTKVITTCI